MSRVTSEDKDQFFADVNTASEKATWAAIATIDGDRPKVRMVHPTWEGDVLWFATGVDTPKAQQLRDNPNIDVQYQVSAPEFVHIMVSGRVELPTDAATKQHVWDTMDYELSEFWPAGVEDPGFQPVKIIPQRVELSEMFGMMNKRVWKAG